MVDRIADPWGPRTPYGPGEAWPEREGLSRCIPPTTSVCCTAPTPTSPASVCDRHAELLHPFARRYAEEAPDEPDRLHSDHMAAHSDEGRRPAGAGRSGLTERI